MDTTMQTLGPRVDGEHPEIVTLVSIDKRMIHHCQAQAREIEQVSRDTEVQAESASDAIMNWETENLGLMNTITRLEDDLQDHRLDLASRAASPERNPLLDRAQPTTNEVMDMINLAFTS
eukprot:16265971-Heterocapsa_arctica.AAC.1